MSNENQQAIFIGHGSPMNAVSNNEYTQFLSNYPKNINPPSAIVVISAHWETEGTYITGAENPEQIYDFYGFPENLYKVKYSPKGMPDLAYQIESEGLGIKVDKARGIDHAGWAVVKHLFPNEDIPLLELSLDINKSKIEHFNFAAELAKYRKENILFVGSGNIVHNLGLASFEENAAPFNWALEMDGWFKKQIEDYNIESLLKYKKILPNYRKAFTTKEHYLPLFYILGMKSSDENVKTIHESIQNGSISMRSIEIS